MEFTYETQNSNSYLVYEIKKNDEIDTLSLGMITNNKIEELASVLYIDEEGKKYLKYNITSKISVKQFFSGTVTKKRLLGVFRSIVNGLLAAEDYMIEAQAIILDFNYIFVDVSTSIAVLICLPVINEDYKPIDLGEYFKSIIFSTQLDQTENCGYIATLINYLNSSSSFNINAFKRVVEDLLNEGNSKVNSTTIRQQGSIAEREQGREAFKIKIEPPRQATLSNGENIQSLQNQPLYNTNISNQGKEYPSNNGNMMTVSSINASYGGNAFNSRIVSTGSNNIPYSNQNNVKENGKKKGWSLFKGKREKKNRQIINQPVQRMTQPPRIQQPIASQVPVSKLGPQQLGTQQRMVQQQEFAQYQNLFSAQNLNPAQPVPGIRNQFQINPSSMNMDSELIKKEQSGKALEQTQKYAETTILETKEENAAGETTILESNPMMDEKHPYLIRRKNNEKILLDKPLFRIGKEKSFVDYFIGDNTSISRSHANIIKREEKYYIVDTNSTNHTYVNGAMIQSNTEVELKHGNSIVLSNEEFEFKMY